MSEKELRQYAENFFDKTGFDADRDAVFAYAETGEGRSEVENRCKNKTKMKYYELYPLIKPFLASIIEGQKGTEAFSYALRFYDYVTMRADVHVADSFVETMQALLKKYSFKEAALLDIVGKDYTGKSGEAVDSSAFQCYYTSQLIRNDPQYFNRLRDELFSLTEEEITLSPRIQSYYCKFLYAVLAEVLEWDEEYDRKALFEKCLFWERLAGRAAVAEAGSLYRYCVHEGVRHHWDKLYYREVNRDNEKYKEAIRREADSIIPYRYQLISFMREGEYFDSGHSGNMGLAYEALIDNAQLSAEFLGKKYVGVVETDVLGLYGDVYFKRHPDDAAAALEALFFCPSKKVTAAASRIVEDNYEQVKDGFNRYLRENTKLSTVNGAAVKALVQKLADNCEDGGFTSLDEAEKYAAEYKLACSSLVNKFDFSQPVYDKTKTRAVTKKFLQVLLDKYFSMKEFYRNRRCDYMAAWLDAESFAHFIDGVFGAWADADYDPKLKAAAVPYCFYTSNRNLLQLKKLCAELCDNARHAIASHIISAMAMSGGKYALMVVDSIANKFPYAKVKQAARDAVSAAAAKYKIPSQVLADIILPDFGFSAGGERTFDFDGETLRLAVSAAGGIDVYRGDKRLKSFPDGTTERAKSAKKEFSALKKEVKTMLSFQSVRLEQALLFGRCWTYGNFKKLFIDNPFLRSLCAQFVWGIYDADGALKQAFRVSFDGTATDAEYNDVTFDGEEIIALVHACDLGAEELACWETFAADNEMKPPFAQLVKPLYPSREIVQSGELNFSKYDLKMSHALKLVNRYNMIRQPVEDGCYDGWYAQNADEGYGFEVNMDKLFVGCGVDDGKNLTVCFYRRAKTNGVSGEDNVYLHLDTAPSRLVCSVLNVLSAACPPVPVQETGTYKKMPFSPFRGECGFDVTEKSV